MIADIGVANLSGVFRFRARKPRFFVSSEDATLEGLRLVSERAIPVGRLLRLWVPVLLKSQVHTLKLQGDVQWVEAAEPSGLYKAGIKLHNTPVEDMRLWQQAILEERFPHKTQP